jgi:Peptidase family M48
MPQSEKRLSPRALRHSDYPRMFALRTFSWPSWTFFVLFAVRLAIGQDSTSIPQPAETAQAVPSSSTIKRIVFDDLVDSVVRQERRLTDVMRSFKPIIETYIQEDGAQPRFQAGIVPNGDDYFLSRLNLAGNLPSIVPFADEETWKRTEEFFVQDPLPFSQAAFAQALFPDLDHFDRQNYTFEFVRWEFLGEVRCAVMDVRPRGNLKTRGFLGRIWVEDQDYSIVRFTGAFTSKGFAKRAFHFDSWRLNMPNNLWMPAYVYTADSNPHDPSSHRLRFKAQTRIWGYDLQNAADHRENAKRQDAPQDLSPVHTEDEATFPPEDTVAERAQAAGLMAPDGDVDQILQTVLNNLLITNKLDIARVRCRVLLTTPLESFVMGRTIVLSRGLLDVLPDEATLAAVLAHELAHVVLGHAVSTVYLRGFALPFPDAQIFAALDFHFDHSQEEAANKKGEELFSKSPYKDQTANVGLFLRALDASSARFPTLLAGRFSDDFRSSHLAGMTAGIDSPKPPKTARPNQIPALPIGSRIGVDPWPARIELLKSKPVRLTPAEKIPFEVTPFYPYLKRLEASEKPSGARQ